MLIDAVKAALWGMMLLVHCLILLVLNASIETEWLHWWAWELQAWSPWTHKVQAYTYEVVPQAASLLQQLEESEQLFEWKARPGETIEFITI